MAPRVAFAFPLVLALGACSSDEARAPSPVANSDAAANAMPPSCGPGETIGEGAACVAIGVPPEKCASGFEPDDARGCRPLLPAAACAFGEIAVPGDESCRPVAPCGDGPFGAIPVDANTIYVDASFVGTSDGSKDKPFTRIKSAIAAAPTGAIVAVAAGSYVESLVVDKHVRIYGRCPSMTEIASSTPSFVTVDFHAGATQAELHDLSIRGGALAVGVLGAKDVVLERVWVHDAGRGVEVSSAVGSITIRDALIERNSTFGVMLSGASGVVERSVVRDSQPSADGRHGRGIVAQWAKIGRSNLTLRGSVLERNHYSGIAVMGATATIDASVVRDTASQPVDRVGGCGLVVADDFRFGSGERADVTVQGSVFSRNRQYGVYVAGSDFRLERTVIQGTLEQDDTKAGGDGLYVQPDPTTGARSKAVVRDSVLADNRESGVAGLESDLTMENVIVRNTKARANDGKTGVGLHLQDTGVFDLRGLLVEGNVQAGIEVLGASMKAERLIVRDTAARSSGALGDGIIVISYSAPVEARIERSRVERSARAGLSSFGAAVSIGNLALDCNAIAMNGERHHDADASFEDRGGVVCGCGKDVGACAVQSSQIAPPDRLEPTRPRD